MYLEVEAQRGWERSMLCQAVCVVTERQLVYLLWDFSAGVEGGTASWEKAKRGNLSVQLSSVSHRTETVEKIYPIGQ